jgi:hypothetical protein
MKFISLNGSITDIKIKPSDYPIRSKEACKSNIQYECGQILKSYYPNDIILEEFYLEDGFYIDFFLPLRKIALEIHGRQHFEFIKHFHGSPQGFKQSQIRDKNKIKWCEINNIQLYSVESVLELKELLNIN